MSEKSIPHGESLPDVDIVRMIEWLRYKCQFQRHCSEPQSSSLTIPEPPERGISYQLTIGLVLRALSGMKRVVKRCLAAPPSSSSMEYDSTPIDNDIHRLNLVLRHFTRDEDLAILDEHYPPSFLYDIANELKSKLDTLSPKLLASYHSHPLYPPHPQTHRLVFERDFLVKVLAFHNQVRRPEGTYEPIDDQQITELATLPRDRCMGCGSRRQLYCGDCGGLRLAIAESVLPSRIFLPFDVHLLIHWQESLHKCTGMHAIAMAAEDQVSYTIWPRITIGGDIAPIIEGLDPDRDILLFPSKDAVSARRFPWLPSHQVDSQVKRYRLVVLEASWNHGKTMANQIISYRNEHQLAPISCVILEDVVGQYWRFQREGNSALSTIEAIAYTAAAAGLDTNRMNELLCLFQAQKYRVLDRVSQGGVPPQAIVVEGSGPGSWKEYTDQLAEP
jgi:DTW domain-containing protein YfiP